MNHRLALLGSLFLVATFACTTSPGEETKRVAQRVEGDDATNPDAGPAACTHPICGTGDGLKPACDACAANVCSQDPYCCDVAWDSTCVGEVTSICGQSCTAAPDAGDADASTCAHPICATGAALASACAPCAAQLCAQDPYCCTSAWDATCVGEVTSICGQACE